MVQPINGSTHTTASQIVASPNAFVAERIAPRLLKLEDRRL
jgi:hypothetical protein